MYSLVIPKYNDKIVPLDDYFAKHKDAFKLGDLDATMLKGMSYDGKLFGHPDPGQHHDVRLPQGHLRRAAASSRRRRSPSSRTPRPRSRPSGKVKYPIAMPLLASGDISTRFMIGLFSQGTTYVDPTTKKPMFNSAQGKKALQSLKDLTPYMDPQVTTFDQPKVQQQLFNGTAAIARDVLRPHARPRAAEELEVLRQVRLHGAAGHRGGRQAVGDRLGRRLVDPQEHRGRQGPGVPADGGLGQRGRRQGGRSRPPSRLARGWRRARRCPGTTP